MTKQKKAGILGIGNLLLLDEGFGIHTIHYLEQNYTFPETIRLNDAGTIPSKMSPHQLGLLEMLEICKLRDSNPETVEFFCVAPADLQTSMELSPQVAQRVKEIAERIVNWLRKAGHTITEKLEATPKVLHNA